MNNPRMQWQAVGAGLTHISGVRATGLSRPREARGLATCRLEACVTRCPDAHAYFLRVLALLYLMLGGAWAGSAATVTVFAAASLTDSLNEIGAAYEKASGDKILFNFAGSSTLARQIQAGAPADVFFSADEATMDALGRDHLLVEGTRRNRLSNTLVIVVASRDGAAVRGPRDLATDKVKRLALAQPKTVPAGIYAREYLRTQNLWPAVETKVIPTANVRAALSTVAAGNAEAGIVYKTDALMSDQVQVAWEIPAKEEYN